MVERPVSMGNHQDQDAFGPEDTFPCVKSLQRIGNVLQYVGCEEIIVRTRSDITHFCGFADELAKVETGSIAGCFRPQRLCSKVVTVECFHPRIYGPEVPATKHRTGPSDLNSLATTASLNGFE